MKFPRLIIGATHSGTGKTTITTGIILALRDRGLIVQPFKVGPDYIDPGFHSLAAGRKSRNLDPVMTGEEGVKNVFLSASDDADISLIEGVMGLYDGLQEDLDTAHPDGSEKYRGSTAHIAKILKAPVVLCIDAGGMSASGAAVALGFKNLDPDLTLAGYILNNIAGERHYRMVKNPIEEAAGLPVFGYLPKNREISLPERHLGLVPAWEKKELPEASKMLTRLVEEYIDIDALIAAADKASSLTEETGRSRNTVFFQSTTKSSNTAKVPIGYALDDAFHFYYQDNLDLLEEAGAELVPFSPIKDTKLPEGVRGLYLGGGYPELFAEGLQRNVSMKGEIFSAAGKGLPVYAECGGLMYLMEELVDFNGRVFSLAGVFKGAVSMDRKLAALGYYEGKSVRDTPISKMGESIWGHVFHWSTLQNLDDNQEFAFLLEKPGREPLRDGLVYRNVLAGYFHLHFAGNFNWVKRFVSICGNSLSKFL